MSEKPEILTPPPVAATAPIKTSIRDATFFDIAVMRCLLSSKWLPSGYLWSLEYLSCRVAEITDFTLREQDAYFKINSSSLPANLNHLFVMMGCDSYDVVESAADSAMTSATTNLPGCENRGNGANDFIELINQIYLENDFFNKKPSSFCNMYDYVKRRKYEASFQARIR